MTPQDRAIEQALSRVRNPLTAIRAFCVTCMGGHVSMIPGCTAPKCPLFAYRMGRNPHAKARGKTFQQIDYRRENPANSEAHEPQNEPQQVGEGLE